MSKAGEHQNTEAAAGEQSAPSPWAPFKTQAFAILWIATVVSNVGTWMHDVGAGWLMTSLDPTPSMVALVQAAVTLPVFLFALPAGAIADIYDRRKLLIAVNLGMSAVASALAVLVYLNLVTPLILLIFTFLLGTGAAFIAPAWQAIVPMLVPRKDLPSAIALNSMGINVSRAIGPALAGVLIAAIGLYAPFALNAVSFIGIIAALVLWKVPVKDKSHALPPERVGHAIRAGLRYVRRSGPFKATLIRAFLFFVFASGYWAMLPLVARDLLNGGPELYGILLGCVGAGAVSGAVILPKIKAALGPNRTVMVGTFGTAAAMATLAAVPNAWAAGIACALGGLSWIAVLSSMHVSAQTALPNWVRARGLSVFLTVFFGAMAAGSLIWGFTANHLGIAGSLLIAAAGLCLGTFGGAKWRLGQAEALDLSPSLHWPEPVLADGMDPDRGPVMVQISYSVDTEKVPDFLEALRELSAERYRDGAYEWGVFEDTEQPGAFVEYFLVDSWLEHLRQHERVSHADADLQERVRSYHSGDMPPTVRHLLAV
ncbi:MAG: MFS transporter [Pseudomonadota bacterium]